MRNIQKHAHTNTTCPPRLAMQSYGRSFERGYFMITAKNASEVQTKSNVNIFRAFGGNAFEVGIQEY